MTDPFGEVVAVLTRLARALEDAGVEYIVGGSVAASVYGDPRATRDVDVAVRLPESKVSTLVAALGPDFAVDEEMVRDAVRRGRSANIFFLPLFLKIDLFMRGQTEYDLAEFARKVRIEPRPGVPIDASSVEDNLLWKLRWFRMGGEVSDQQWRDIAGLIRIRGERMDRDYLSRWASFHGVADLLDRAWNAERE